MGLFSLLVLGINRSSSLPSGFKMHDSGMGVNSLCTFFLCCLRESLVFTWALQTSQANALNAECVVRWLVRKALRINLLPHIWQT